MMPGSSGVKLTRDFYLSHDVRSCARQLLGKYLCTLFDGVPSAGMITETEAYAGITDRASHAWNGRNTARTSVMYRTGGTAYVYLCYGVHHLFNVVTNVEGTPDAVLVRGIYPVTGLEIISRRTGKTTLNWESGYGPGKVSKSLGINTSHSSYDLLGNVIWIEDRGFNPGPGEIITGRRIGVEYAGEDALLPYRFTLRKDCFQTRDDKSYF